MLETLKSMLVDFQEATRDTGVPRRLDIEAVPGKATVCIGVRRAGKSTYLFQVVDRLLSSGVDRQNILYVNFFDDRLRNLEREGLGLITEAYYSLFPDTKDSETVYCFFDEIQAVQQWEPFVDRLMRTERCEVYLTGSSAHMLSREIATQMRGRALSWEIFPFSFAEFLDAKSISWDEPLSTKKRLIVQNAFDEYWQRGGFPEVVGLDRRLRTRVHQEYLHAILFRDLVERHDISHPNAVRDLAYRLLENAACMYSINSLTGYLKSLGHTAPKAAVSDYVAWFEDAYFLFTTTVFDASAARRRTNPKKIYCVDHALVTSVVPRILVNSGHLLENLVFTALRRVTPEIHYYKTASGGKVDFVADRQDGPRMLVQVCESMAASETRTREVSALAAAMAELGLDRGTIVTRTEEDTIEVESGSIRVLPAWRFLLELEAAERTV